MYTGFIYKIVADDTDKVYYGSTTMKLNRRFSKHKYNFKCEHSCSSIELFNFPNARIELLETHHHLDKTALKQILCEVERGYIERFRKYCPGRCVNINLPNLTTDYRKEYQKQYHIDNTDRIKEQVKQYYIDNTDKIKEYDRLRYLKIKDYVKDKKKQYYIDNKDKIKERRRLKYLKMKELNSQPEY